MKTILITLVSLSLAATSASAIPGMTLVTNDAPWPSGAVINSGTPGDSYALSGGGTAVITYAAERDVKQQRELTQTFTVNGPGLAVSDMYFGYVAPGDVASAAIQVRIFQVDDVHGRGSDGDDDQIIDLPGIGGELNMVELFTLPVTVSSASLDASDLKVIHFDVTDVTLLGGTYAISLYNPSTANEHPFKWAIERGDGLSNAANLGPYLGGRGYSDNAGSAEENHDWAFAIDGAVVPEPSTYALVMLGAIGAFVFLRRRR